VCKPCTDSKVRKLCVNRQAVREEKIQEFTLKIKEWVKSGAARTKTLEKDKKGETRQYWPRKRGSEAMSTKSSSGSGANGSSIFKKKISPPGNPLGNKRMAVPEELLPAFCRKISAKGTRKRMDTINAFVRENPSVSIRQVTFKFANITTRERPGCIEKTEKPKGKGRAFIFFLRPKYYNLLPEDERPENWERYMKEDEIVFQEEKRKEEEEKAIKDKNLKEMKEMMGDDATVSSQADVTSIATSRSLDTGDVDGGDASSKINGSQDGDDDNDADDVDDDDDDMTEDEAEPSVKKFKPN